ncbi:hypothetical protein HDG34_004197 [Paraburkholderia sp. HC6.4b]|uniref:hypothetical protein n=1 Tax=unclassified Paraburkholderia TaxID=2615204 RepID=UPI0017FA6ADA|nr:MULTISPECIES: hypothetical protein [unclassified Paraburkholderia]MBB5410244.1 hypothetical protein [Paraburkholderia sp. HC6.4b]MBB5452453.1 hypothetical protein [Paraburkholderia sp. Kb1A]
MADLLNGSGRSGHVATLRLFRYTMRRPQSYRSQPVLRLYRGLELHPLVVDSEPLQSLEFGMERNDLLKWIRCDGGDIVDRFLPPGAQGELDSLIHDRRHEIDAGAFLMFMSIRALLCERGMESCDSDREAGQIMAMLST